MFEEERSSLTALPLLHFAYFKDLIRTVCDDTTVRVDSSNYAAGHAPHEGQNPAPKSPSLQNVWLVIATLCGPSGSPMRWNSNTNWVGGS